MIHPPQEECIPIVNKDNDPFLTHSRRERDMQIDRGIAGNKESKFALLGRRVIEAGP